MRNPLADLAALSASKACSASVSAPSLTFAVTRSPQRDMTEIE